MMKTITTGIEAKSRQGDDPHQLWLSLTKPGLQLQVSEPVVPARVHQWGSRIGQHTPTAKNVRAQEWYFACALLAINALKDSVEIDDNRRGGMPVLKGTGFSVAQALAELAESCGIDEVAGNFDLNPETLRKMLYGLSLILERPYSR